MAFSRFPLRTERSAGTRPSSPELSEPHVRPGSNALGISGYKRQQLHSITSVELVRAQPSRFVGND